MLKALFYFKQKANCVAVAGYIAKHAFFAASIISTSIAGI
jgi:hypothetical protein